MHAVLLGASKGVGYFTALYLLEQPDERWTCTLLLRNPTTLSTDPQLKTYIDQGRLSVVKGDATSEEDVGKFFGEKVTVDVVISSIGAAPVISWKGVSIDQPTLCTDGMATLVKVLGKQAAPLPRVVALSSMGIGDSHDIMPLTHRVLYPWVLHAPHADKEGLEYLLFRASNFHATPTTHVPTDKIISTQAISTVPENILSEIIIVRPAWMVGGDEPPQPKEMMVSGEQVKTATVRRSEVGRFIVEECMPGSQTWVNKAPIIGYKC